MMLANPQLDNYLHWHKARGLPVADDACPYCSFRPQGQSAWRICAYRMNKSELQLLRRVVPDLHPSQCVRLYTCPAAGGGLCILQQRDLCRVNTVVLLGNIAARLVGGERNFARQQGKPYCVAGWGKVSLMLTFHPSDVQRYPSARQLWRQDLQRAGCPVELNGDA